MPKENETVAPAQTDPALNRFFSDDEDLISGEETVETEETPEVEEPEVEDLDPEEIPEVLEDDPASDTDEPDKFRGKSREDIIKSYQNLEALYGKKAAEPKPAEAPADLTKEYYPSDIPTMPDNVLDLFIADYEDYLQTPNQSLDDSENFGRKTIEYNKMMMEKAKRQTVLQHSVSQLQEHNKQVKASYEGSKHLTAEELDHVAVYATTKLSDDGKLTIGDMDVAMHKLFPDKWIKRNIDKDKQRIANAQTRQTPRIAPSGGSGNPPSSIKSVKEIAAMNEWEYDAYLETLDSSQLAQLKQKLK